MLKHAFFRKILAVLCHGRLQPLPCEPILFRKGAVQRRPDKARQRIRILHLDAEMGERVLIGAGDARHGVDNRAVQIEQDHLFFSHILSPVHCFLLL